ncbi:MAG: PHP domain-containing protein [Promethearchaeota archaeon]
MANQFHLFDLHCHTPFSDAQWGFDTIIQGLIDNGIKIVGFADHVNPVSLYRNPKRLGKERRFVYTFSRKFLNYRRNYFKYLDKKYKKIRILCGGEIDIYPHGGIALPPGISAADFDYLLLVKHFTLPPFPYNLKEYLWEKGLYKAFTRYKPDIFGHPQDGMPIKLPIYKLKRMMLMAKKLDIALELNHVKRYKKYDTFLEMGHQIGNKFSLGSDFHGFQDDIKKQLNHTQEMYELVEKYDLNLIDPRKFIRH